MLHITLQGKFPDNDSFASISLASSMKVPALLLLGSLSSASGLRSHDHPLPRVMSHHRGVLNREVLRLHGGWSLQDWLYEAPPAAEPTGADALALQAVSFMFVAASTIVTFVPATHLSQTLGAANATRLLSNTRSASALTEILLAPVVGSLVDAVGRKPVLLGVMYSMCAAYASVALFPRCVSAMVVATYLGNLAFGLFFLASQALLADLFKSKPTLLAAATGAQLAIVQGGGTLVSIGLSTLPKPGVDTLYSMASSAMLGACAVCVTFVAETIPKKLPFALSAALLNPFAFVRLFRASRRMTQLTILLSLQLAPLFMGDVLQVITLTSHLLPLTLTRTLTRNRNRTHTSRPRPHPHPHPHPHLSPLTPHPHPHPNGRTSSLSQSCSLRGS